MVPVGLAHPVEVGPAGPVLRQPFPGERPVLDLVEDPLHLRAGLVGDDPGPPGVVAVLGGVADRVAHELHPAPVHQVDDQLELVQALEVRHLRAVAGGGQGLEARLHQRRDAAAEHRLLAEQVGLGLLAEGRLDDARAGTADARGVGQGVGQGLAARVLVHRHEPRHAPAALELAPDQVSGRLGRHHRDVHARGRRDLAVVDVEPVGEHQRLARLEPLGHAALVDGPAVLVGGEHHDDIGRGRGLGDRPDVEAGGLGLVPRAAALPEADDDLGAAVAEVEGVGVPLAAVADDGEGAAGKAAAVGVGVVVHAHGIVRHDSVSR